MFPMQLLHKQDEVPCVCLPGRGRGSKDTVSVIADLPGGVVYHTGMSFTDRRPPLFCFPGTACLTGLLLPSLLAMKMRLRSSQGQGCSARICWFLAGLLVPLHVVGAFPAAASAAAAEATAGTSYTEDLTLERLGKHHVAARFVFRSHWVPQERHRCQDHEDWHEGGQAEGNLGSTRAGEGGKLCHFEAVFPRAVGVLVDRFKARLRLDLLGWAIAAGISM